MKNNDWKFWFAIMGAVLTASAMFWNLKVEFAKTQVEVEHIKKDVAYIKEFINKEQKHEHYQAFQIK